MGRAVILFMMAVGVCVGVSGGAEYRTFNDSIESIAEGKGLPTPPKPVEPEKLEIVSAKYGAEDKWLDVTDELRSRVDSNRLSIYVSNNIAGDPFFGHPKHLVVTYILDGVEKEVRVREGKQLQIPRPSDPMDALSVIETPRDLTALAKVCPAEVGFYGINLNTGATLGYRSEQPACLASIVKLFVLLEIMRQQDAGGLKLSESVEIDRGGEKESCTITEAIDKMIGVSDNEATTALARRVGYENVDALAKKLSIEGLSMTVWPRPGGLEEQLDKRVFGAKVLPKDKFLPQHGTARSVVEFFKLLHEGKLFNKAVSEKVLASLMRNPKRFAPRGTPAGCESVGKGGSIIWKRPPRPQYNMLGWGLYVFDEKRAAAFCVWFEWFPESMPENKRWAWANGFSDCVVDLLLNEEKQASLKESK
ncbi:hypothetical protein STSP2_00013 [Anaerohalosphaera lusitana]|uniref:beta-lactamase n=1 Tax=Anaerohalosphaera lusitana TaxID=1936003 RepID=A0A1U9NGD6_9BACT|nr:serine hydrolase [Anaerohalosphaera lusitana]AQT66875.1 hypothetical protein STSP2_00013 [Anaerohalosphaera lusitana]